MSETRNNKSNKNILAEEESVLEHIKKLIEDRFNALRDEAIKTTDIWTRYDINVILKELKNIYEEIQQL